ncbi:hypothetical protein HY003_01515 [Candidatus Saccharibacteria bacterium]|nr:hypothetical protein [Candidatus Saccharibacteria bacterium]
MSLGMGAWIYAKVHRQTGGNVKNALIVASVGGGIVFLIVVTGLSLIFT